MVGSGCTVHQGKEDIGPSKHDDVNAAEAEKPRNATAIAIDNILKQTRVPKRTVARHVLRLLFVLVLGGGGYFYFTSSLGDRAEFAAAQLTEGADTGTELSAEQMVDVRYVAHQQIQAVASPDQVIEGSLDETGSLSVNEAFFSMQGENSNQAETELSNILEHGTAAETDLGELHTSDSDELLLPHLQEEIQAVLQEATEILLVQRKDSVLPDTEEMTAVYVGPSEAWENDGSERNEAISPIAEERVKLKKFLAAGSFDVVPIPTPRETNTSKAARPGVTFSSPERGREVVDPDPEHIIDWLLEERKARKVQ